MEIDVYLKGLGATDEQIADARRASVTWAAWPGICPGPGGHPNGAGSGRAVPGPPSRTSSPCGGSWESTCPTRSGRCSPRTTPTSPLPRAVEPGRFPRRRAAPGARQLTVAGGRGHGVGLRPDPGTGRATPGLDVLAWAREQAVRVRRRPRAGRLDGIRLRPPHARSHPAPAGRAGRGGRPVALPAVGGLRRPGRVHTAVTPFVARLVDRVGRHVRGRAFEVASSHRGGSSSTSATR